MAEVLDSNQLRKAFGELSIPSFETRTRLCVRHRKPKRRVECEKGEA